MSTAYKWQFTAKLRTSAFCWRASQLATRRLQEAVLEIRKCGRQDPVLAAEGAIRLIEKLWPAFQHIDTSSGLLGSAVGSAVHEVIDIPFRRRWTPQRVRNGSKGYGRLSRRMGRPEEAIRYAEASRSPYCSDWVIDHECEAILLSIDQRTEAYARYGFSANQKSTGLATFRAIAAKYPEKNPREILDGLIRLKPGAEGKWFATARQLGFLDMAIKLAQTSPCDPRTLNRAAKDLLRDHPAAALAIALASLRWMCQGYGYELTGIDVSSACASALKAGEAAGRGDEIARQIAEFTRSHPFVNDFCRKVDPRIARASGVLA